MRVVAIAVLTALTLTSPLRLAAEESNPIEVRLVDGLQAQGYTILDVSYTWLGRLRIVAENGITHRELVVNPGTGEVLRDYAVLMDPAPGTEAATLHHNRIAPSSDGQILSSSALNPDYRYGTPDKTLLSGVFMGGTGPVSVIAPGEKGVPSVLLTSPAPQE